MGERAFWAGLRQYTRTYFGKSVTTPDFQAAMEQASGKNLSDIFFNVGVFDAAEE
jgi:aminopeptidase N